MDEVTAFPLTWPALFPRTRKHTASRFKTALAPAIKNVQTSLRLFANESGKPLSGLTISSNVTLGVAQPADPGVAVWFTAIVVEATILRYGWFFG